MAFSLGARFEDWLDRKIETLKEQGILKSRTNLDHDLPVISDDDENIELHNGDDRGSIASYRTARMSDIEDEFRPYNEQSPARDPQGDYYKFVWQDDEDFESQIGFQVGIKP